MAQIIGVPFSTTITSSFLEKIYENAKIVLFKFGQKRNDRVTDYFDQSAISFLISKGVKVIGTDNGSVDSLKTGWGIHTQILSKEVLIIEGLYLEEVDAGDVFLICLPLSIPGAEGSPARAVLIK
jgi:kynurenine formamidase